MLPANDKNAMTGRQPSAVIWTAVMLISLGGLLILRDFTMVGFRNWWALFILLGTLGCYWSAYAAYRAAGRVNWGVITLIYSGIFPLAVAVIFLFEMSWSIWWPLFVLLPGLGLLAFGLAAKPRSGKPSLALRSLKTWLGWMGLSAALLGLTFLAKNAGVFDPAAVHPNWWALFILIPAVGGLIMILRTLLSPDRTAALLVANLIAMISVGATGIVALLGIDWNLLKPIMLIGLGLALLVGFMGKRN